MGTSGNVAVGTHLAFPEYAWSRVKLLLELDAEGMEFGQEADQVLQASCALPGATAPRTLGQLRVTDGTRDDAPQSVMNWRRTCVQS
jgi:hypothetical protein